MDVIVDVILRKETVEQLKTKRKQFKLLVKNAELLASELEKYKELFVVKYRARDLAEIFLTNLVVEKIKKGEVDGEVIEIDLKDYEDKINKFVGIVVEMENLFSES